MQNFLKLFFLNSLLVFCIHNLAYGHSKLPANFVYVNEIIPSIKYDIRYAGYHNFVGHPIDGYFAKQCILTKPAALALKKVQQELLQSQLTLKVYDCYRPQRAVNEFFCWSKQPEKQKEMEALIWAQDLIAWMSYPTLPIQK